MKKILVNANKNNIKVAILYKEKLHSLYIENISSKQINHIYIAKIKYISLSLEAFFIDYGKKKIGFLPFKKIYKKIFNLKKINIKNKKFLNNILNKNFLVQIVKEQNKHKRAVLTTFIKFFGIYLILILNKPNIKKISKKIKGIERKRLKKKLYSLKIPNDVGIILRTSSYKVSFKTLNFDFNYQLRKLKLIQNKSFIKKKNNNSLIDSKNYIFVSIFRYYLTYNINKIVIDNKNFFNNFIKFIIYYKKNKFIKNIKYFQKSTFIFNYYKINLQINSIYKKNVKLFSGGSLTIDSTEALTVIDVNSSHYNKSYNIESTAFHINFNSIFEIVYQLRLRNLEGIIVIDFINMSNIINIKKIENTFYKIIKEDLSKIQLGKISKFGLLELSRKKFNFFE
ncbi:ribonuclease E/G [Buchnera aphidicola]|uniref:ribonuclease E/G n=1 Tax=Buchnera aphidicola TaxID=9 RepID=UPI00223745B0|nr:ribonuclease E/G [Buchnera aphidicola]MCW5197773.1 ribonuclease E/G [Buchnera aphidicola (Chaitophorus viminalis)]